ncbi:MAG: hypothetical protein AAF449_23465, partial [Myxococcota bacterium]
MQTSVAGEIAARLALFQSGFEFCRQGGFSFARFLALVPDRLRLALGDGGHRVRLPVTVANDAVRRLEEHLPVWTSDARPGAAQSASELRQVVRFAQQDPGISPVGLLSWLRLSGDPLLNLLVSLYERGFGEVGRGEGGAETAYLIHLVIVELARRTILDAAPDKLGASVVLTAMLDAAIAGVLTSSRVNDNHLSPRLGYQLASTRSPLAFGLDADELAARPVNIYRTIPRALQLARRVVQPPVEVIPLDRVAETLAKRMLVEPELQAALLKDILLEMVRDAALIGTMQAYRPSGDNLSVVLSELLGSPKALMQAVFNQARRERLIGRLQEMVDGPKAVAALTDLLRGVPAVEQGDARPLGVHGNLEERALLAA